MEIKINTETRTIILNNDIKLIDLIEFCDQLNMDFTEWTIKVEPQIITIKDTSIPKLPDWTNPNLPWVNPYTTPIGTPPYIQPGITYPTDFPWKPNYYEVTCLM